MGTVDEAKLNFLEYLMVHHRWVVTCFLLLPVSLLYDVYFYARNWIVFKLSSAASKHDSKVQDIQRQVRNWNDSGRTKKMCTARPGYLTMCFREPNYKSKHHGININLVDILQVDTNKETVRVEPMVTMGQLTATLIPLGWTIPVVTEIDEVTVGGAINGSAMESSSHKYGLFQHICESLELVMADGSLVKCSKTENSDLFYAVPWSHGTIGFLVAAELKIIPCKNYVKLTYIPCHSLKETVDVFTAETKNVAKNEFVEAMAYSLDTSVVIVGEFAEMPEPGKLNDFGKWYKPWFYEHVRNYLKYSKTKPAPNGFVEFMPLRDYYHRHARSIFWELEPIIPFGNNVLFRYLFGWAIPPKISFLKLTHTEGLKKLYTDHRMIEDFWYPIAKLEDAIRKNHELFDVYPLWLGPMLIAPNPGMCHPKGDQAELFVEFGVYGEPRNQAFVGNAENSIRAMEDYLRSIGGFQMTYVDVYQTPAEFRTMFDHSLYDAVRKRYGCLEAFPDVYDKVSIRARK